MDRLSRKMKRMGETSEDARGRGSYIIERKEIVYRRKSAMAVLLRNEVA